MQSRPFFIIWKCPKIFNNILLSFHPPTILHKCSSYKKPPTLEKAGVNYEKRKQTGLSLNIFIRYPKGSSIAVFSFFSVCIGEYVNPEFSFKGFLPVVNYSLSFFFAGIFFFNPSMPPPFAH